MLQQPHSQLAHLCLLQVLFTTWWHGRLLCVVGQLLPVRQCRSGCCSTMHCSTNWRMRNWPAFSPLPLLINGSHPINCC
jgi:hypothetical protein